MQIPAAETIPGSKVRFHFIVTPDEAKPYIDEAIKKLSQDKPISGFRPGHAPYDEVAKVYGEMRIWETALQPIVRAWYMRAVLDQNIDTVGSPEIQVDKIAPGSDIEFTVIAPVAPRVEQVADYSIQRVEEMKIEVKDEDVNRAVEELRRMQRREVVTTEPATKNDLVVIDLDMKRDQVLLEGGTARGYRVYLAEDQLIPGFAEKLVGMKPGESRSFTLTFPEGHYQKHLAGKEVLFEVTAKEIFRIELPEANDAFAESLGQSTLLSLRMLLRSNLEKEEVSKAKQKSEIELLEKLVDESTFSEVPELLVNEEVKRMLHELEHSIEEQGMKFDDYLTNLKKTKDELRLDFAPQAIRRIKTATLIKDVAKRESIRVSDADVDAEVDRILSGLKEDDKETRERVSSPEYREYIGTMLRNYKTLDLLKKNGIKPPA